MFVWTIGDALSLLAVVVVLVVGGCMAAAESWKQSRCKHDGGITETGSCDAICRKCLKNLGFIGSWREKQNSN